MPDEPRAILFDLDGTLVDTVPTRIASWAVALDEAGLPHERAELGRLIGMDGKEVVRHLVELAGLPFDIERAEEIDARSGALYDRLNLDPRPLPGVGKLLAELDERRVTWAIATSSRAAQVGTSVGALGLVRQPTIVDGSSVTRAKPAPDLLLRAAEVVGVAPSDCWYVGDSIWDMVAGVAAGMTTIAITAGAAVGADDLRQAGAVLVLDTAGDLIDRLPA